MSVSTTVSSRIVSSFSGGISILFIFGMICFQGGFHLLNAQSNPECPVVWDPGDAYYVLPSSFGQQNNTAIVKVYFHVFQEDDGTGGLSLAQIEEVKALLDNSFNPHDIYFLYHCEVDFIKNSFLYHEGLAQYPLSDPDFPFATYYPYSCDAGTTNIFDDGINIYFVKAGGARGLAGSIPSTYFLIAEPFYSDGTLPHEMGHCLGLKHTYAGSAGNVKMTCGDYNVPDVYVSCEGIVNFIPACAETADGSNCDHCGDNICDTPADYVSFICESDYPRQLGGVSWPCPDEDPSCYSQVPGTFNWFYIVDPNCDLYSPEYNNYMSLGQILQADCRDHFSTGQGLVMHHFLQEHPVLANVTRTPQEYANSVDCDCNPQDVHLYSATTFSGDEIINGNLILHAGADVLVTGTLRFPEGKGIEVKRGSRLKVEGGLLTIACDQHHWEGIFVEGNASIDQSNPGAMPQSYEAGVVLLTLGATIEKAGIAINTIKRAESWNADFWGGLVFAQDAYFKDCYRAAAFMKYRPYIGHSNKSRFIGCDIRGTGNYWPNSTGITIWATDGIQFRENTFEDIKRSGLLVYDAFAEVFHDNLFEGNRYGIQGIASAPFMGSMIIGKSNTGIHRNVFRDNFVHIYGAGLQHPGKGKYVVANNDFFNGLAGIVMDGTNNYTVRKNSFLNQPLGSVVWHAGEDLNDFECNAFQDDQVSILYSGDNERSQFLENVFFNSTNADVYLEGSQALTTIRHPQGTPGHPADNCFGPETGNIITIGATTLFDYILETGTPIGSCKKPWCNLSDGCTNPNYYKLFSTSSLFPERCSNPDPSIPTDPQYDIKDSLYNHWLGIYEADTTNVVAHHNMVEYGSQRHQAMMDYVGNMANAGQDSMLINFLSNQGTAHSKRLLYGFYLNQGNYTDAAAVLSDLSSSISVADQHFVAAQQINLSYYQSPGQFVLDSVGEQLLLNIAFSEHSDRAWARSMLIFHAGYEFYPEEIASPRSSNKEQNLIHKTPVWNLYPNPVNDLLYFNSSLDIANTPVTVTMFDMLGRTVLREVKSGGSFSISASLLVDGIYIAQLQISGGSLDHYYISVKH